MMPKIFQTLSIYTPSQPAKSCNQIIPSIFVPAGNEIIIAKVGLRVMKRICLEKPIDIEKPIDSIKNFEKKGDEIKVYAYRLCDFWLQ